MTGGSVRTTFMTRFLDHITDQRDDLALPDDLDSIVRECLRLGIHALDATADQARIPVAKLAETGAEIAREGIPLEGLLGALHETARRGLRELDPQSSSAATKPTGEVYSVMRLLEVATVATASGYVQEHRLTAREHQTAAQASIVALLSGQRRLAMDLRAHIPLAQTYEVVALHIPRHASENGTRLHAEISARRKLNRLQAALPPVLGSHTLALLSAAGGIILVPNHDPVGRAVEGAVITTPEAFDLLTGAAAVPLTAAVVAGPVEDIPTLAAQAYELLELARTLRRPPGLYRMADLAVEYQLTRPGTARDHLIASLSPLERHPDLLDALRAYLDCGLDRGRTADRLGVHPNSVTNRLRRIHRVSGLDLTDTEGISRAALALLGRELEAHENRAV
ncbi:PucR family transcriptional regulator [Nocardia sp. ET3-3]|uniref:PucR family transcriptional regulator n=1 Tax=Nocardia terrae TaxID=2675851 RepID=A0A7K1UTR8_9NOCA|nr:helix-turn-helix domain-containing protein [Nocardia terrae]MVU77559.1 PucR family transcriptional regulator [Nocardia terrae]